MKIDRKFQPAIVGLGFYNLGEGRGNQELSAQNFPAEGCMSAARDLRTAWVINTISNQWSRSTRLNP